MENDCKLVIDFNESLIRRIVYAVNKAVADDAPYELRQHRLETNNRWRFAVGDFINENLRKEVVNDEIELIPFKRYCYEGRILVDHKNKITYTIATFSTIQAGPKKHGNKPYYLQSILFAENGDCEGMHKQMTLADYAVAMGLEPFTENEFVDDYNDIMQGMISKEDGYRHYIIGYSKARDQITNIRLLYLDKDFAEVDSCDLMGYVVPDFASLTNMDYTETDTVDMENQERHPLKLKPGVKLALRVKEEEA